MKEKAVLMGQDRALVGVLTEPSTPDADAPAVLLLNSGIVHRVGPARLYVKLARALANRGHCVVRFDGSGIGDSPSAKDTLAHEERFVKETIEVLNDLEYERRVEKFVLMGICSGAVTSFKAAVEDPRVVGAVLMNPQGFDASSAWNTHVKSRKWMREYVKRLFSLQAWGRALSGKSRYGRFFGLLVFRIRSLVKRDEEVVAVAGNLADEAATLIARKVHLLFLMTTGDESNDYLRMIMGAQSGPLRRSPFVEQQTITGSDHTFTCLGHQEQVIRKITEWLKSMRQEGARADNSALPAEPEGTRQ